MCGIAACISTDALQRGDFAQKAKKLQHHRGPDDNGLWEDDLITLVHTRLSILDLSSAGHQPMVSRSGRYVIAFNGEVYNHLELRKRFLQDHVFKGHSDTETILALYERMGAQMLEYLVGMWAIAIWDREERKVFVSRDRYGQKPLYWTKKGESLFFSSEIKPLLYLLPEAVPNDVALSEYLGLGNYGHLYEQTFYRDISQILPSHFYVFDDRCVLLNKSCYWQIEEIPYRERLPLDDRRAKEFREIVFNAVESQLLSDVQVGATLSGGLDSSIIVSCIAELGRQKFPVFTAQFPGKYDESVYVESIRKKWGNALEVIYTPVTELSLSESLETVIHQQEEPFGDPSIMAHGFLVRAAKDNDVPVLLGGQGGDEISMGYEWMYQRLFSYALNSGDVLGFFNFIRQQRTSAAHLLRLTAAGILPSMEHRLRLRMRKKQKSHLSARLMIDSPGNSFGKVDSFMGIYLESLRTVGLPHLCHYDDRSTMALSIEGRMPFLDHRLLEFVSKLQPSAFYRNGFSKNIFRTAFADILPMEIVQRKDKIGFHTPVIDLLLKDREWVTSILEKEQLTEWLDPAFLGVLRLRLQTGGLDVGSATLLFRTISTYLWVSQFLHKQTLFPVCAN